MNIAHVENMLNELDAVLDEVTARYTDMQLLGLVHVNDDRGDALSAVALHRTLLRRQLARLMEEDDDAANSGQ